MKVTKDIAAQLFKYVKRVDITFNPFDGRTRSARELMNRVKSERLARSNPNMKVKTNIVATADPPSVSFEFIDGTKKDFDSQKFVVNEMLNDVYIVANNIDIEYEMEGKSVDD